VLAVAQFHAPLPLTNTIQRYDWGSVEAIPHLLGNEPDGGPQAELWLGAHTSAPSVSVIEDEDVALDRLVREAPGRRSATAWRSSSAPASPTC
jgi:mannose-6-phosphate isomerase